MKNKFLVLLLVMCVIFTFGNFNQKEKVYGEQERLNESLNEIVNPDCGFYYAFSGRLYRNGSESPVSESKIASNCKDYGLYHLRIGLEDFSQNAGGVDSNITDSAKTALKTMFSYLRKYKISAIIRFSYNVNGDCDSNGDYLESEPSLQLIKQHISSLGAVISEYSDVILSVDSGMVGPWGEQHSTALGSASSSNANTYYTIVEEWLNALPQEITVTVRRPRYFIYWANEKYSLELTENNLGQFSCENYPEAQRVGFYNDGYLGSSSDLGTFKNRESEVTFIGKQSENILYGGEVVADSKTDELGKYNKVEYLEQEAFITHTSYLNISWNYENVISKWQENTYNGVDELYNGKVSEFTFVKNRLGYRLVVNSFNFSQSEDNKSLTGEITISNKGFGNMIRKPTVYFILQSSANEYRLDCDLDLTEVKSKEEKTFAISALLPENLVRGNYSLQLKCETAYGRDIVFANSSDMINENNAINLCELSCNAVVERSKFLVTFDLNYGTLVSGSTSQIVNKGESAEAPTVVREGYNFLGWSKDITNITQDTAVIAIWEKIPQNSSSSVSENSSGFSNSSSSSSSGENGCSSSVFGGGFAFAILLSAVIKILKTKSIA